MARMNHTDSRRQSRQSSRRAEHSYSYTEGNTVRRTDGYTYPEEQELSGQQREAERRREREEQRKNARIRRNQEKALQMNPGFVFFTALAAAAVLFMAVNYLKVQTSVVSLMEQIEEKEQKLEEVRADNAVLERQLQTYVDLDYIYEVATQELGMVHPDQDQVIYYDQVESEYVRQYDEIPR